MRRRGGVGLAAMGVVIGPALPLLSFLKVQVLSLRLHFHQMGVFWALNYHWGSWKGETGHSKVPVLRCSNLDVSHLPLARLSSGWTSWSRSHPVCSWVEHRHFNWEKAMTRVPCGSATSSPLAPRENSDGGRTENSWETESKRKAYNRSLTSFWVSF